MVVVVTSIVLITTWGGSEYEWGSPTIRAMIGLTVVLLPILFVVERRALEPVVPVHLFSLRTFSVSSATGLIIGVALFVAISFLPLFPQVVNGASSPSSGLRLFPQDRHNHGWGKQ